MRLPPRGRLVAIVLASALYVALGLGFHRASVACYDSRHSLDHEPMIGVGATGVVIDVVLWPFFQVFTPPDLSCQPRPLG